jgi:hypothetical protein
MPKDGLSCNWCGYINVQSPEPAVKPVAAVPKRESVAAPALELGDDEDDNGEPYLLPPEEIKTRPCTNCGKRIEEISVVCIHCGYDSESKQKIERKYQAIDREWESGWPLSLRLAILGGCQLLNVATIAFGMAVGGTLPGSFGAIAFYIFLQAFLLGTYDSTRIRRNQKGKADVFITWRVCFIPQKPKKINWREHEGVGVGHYHAGSVFDWIIVFTLLPFFIVPGILWWYYMIYSDRFFAALCRDRGYPETYLYRGLSEKQAKEVAQIATDATGLPLTTPL